MKNILILFCFVSLWGVHFCEKQKWYDSAILYELYPMSFKDTDGDGIGDIAGIIEKLDYLKDIGIDGFWVTPMYPSGGVDRGYDITDFIGVDPLFGSMSDFDRLLKKAHFRGIKVILDFVPNHTSDQHVWFQKSIEKIKPYDDYYVWKDGKGVNKTSPPNNWLSVFGGPAWTYNEKRKQFYLHQFYSGQPDLNYRCKHVYKEIKDVIEFWLNKGVDGFRIDALAHAYEDANFTDAGWLPGRSNTSQKYEDQYHDPSTNQPETFDLNTEWRAIIDECSKKLKKDIVMFVEVYTSMENSIKYITYKGKKGANFPFNFQLKYKACDKNTNATSLSKALHEWLDFVPKEGLSNWVIDNHDQMRVIGISGREIMDSFTMLSLLLPGVGITYYGDEIGMANGLFRSDQVDDSSDRFFSRTPMQWDKTKNAGFTMAKRPWLPINTDYWHLNVESQLKAEWSFLKLYKAVAKIKKTETCRLGDLKTYILSDYVFAAVRYLTDKDTYIIVVNYNSIPEEVNLEMINKISETLYVAVPSLNSGYSIGQRVVSDPSSDSKAKILLRPRASLVLIQTADGKPYVDPNHKHEEDNHKNHEHDEHEHHHSSASGLVFSSVGALLVAVHVMKLLLKIN